MTKYVILFAVADPGRLGGHGPPLLNGHGGAVGSALGFGSKHPSSKLGRDNCVEALSPHRVTAVGKLLTLNCLGGDWPSFTFILTLLSSDCGLSVVSTNSHENV